ncbi:MAG TPA: hypothetical protein PLP22_09985 [Candidatus Competibacter sp.]|nr:hypothetical protein [Candidatus Competibacter sp.]HUM95915.1 hypothetical protein [Candidatus Competibacter sp.]
MTNNSQIMPAGVEPIGPRSAVGVLAAALGGLALTALVLLIFYRAGGLASVAPPVVLNSADLRLMSGQGEQTATGLEVRQASPQGVISVQGSAGFVRAAVYRQLTWRADGVEPSHDLRLMWTTLAEPRTVREKRLPPPTEPNAGTVDMSAEPEWRGRIAVIGLVAKGPLERPLVIRRLKVQAPALGTAELARLAFEEWTAFEDWSQRSINYVAGAPLDALFPPVLMAALWVGFSAGLYAVFVPFRRTGGGWRPYLAFLLVGWLALDARWQWDLSRRLERTESRFAGKEGDERLLAGLDGELYRFLLEVRRRLPEKPSKLYIVSADPGDFQSGRARYHLLPHNGYMKFSQPPAPGVARPGEYVLILSPLPGVRYDRERRRLDWTGGALPADLLYGGALGALLQVRGG